MTAADVLAQARAAGVDVLVYEGRLASRGPATPELRAAIRAHRHGLVALLTGKPAPSNWPELPPLPADDEHARWLRGEISKGEEYTPLGKLAAAYCRHCNKALGARAVVYIGHGVLLHHACGRALCP